MKIYTKTGDKGETSLVDGQRVSKTHPRVEAYGTVDELNSQIGLCIAEMKSLKSDPELESHSLSLEKIQNCLFDMGSHLACEKAETLTHLPPLKSENIPWLEGLIDKATEKLPPLKEFILPGGHSVSALLHVGRTICRRAERHVVGLGDTSPSMSYSIQFLNRLSDYLFVLARLVNFTTKTPEVKWKKQN